MSAKGFEQFKDYLKYKEGCEVHNEDYGFVIYKVFDSHIDIHNIWVDKDRRRDGLGVKLMMIVNDIAKDKGFKYITGAVDLNQDNATESMKAVVSKMKVLKDNYVVQFYKEVV